MDVGRVISDISLLDKVDSAGNIYYEFPDSHLFYSLEYINALVTKHVIISCKQFYDGICEARRRFIETHNAQHVHLAICEPGPCHATRRRQGKKDLQGKITKDSNNSFCIHRMHMAKTRPTSSQLLPRTKTKNIYASCGFTLHH